VSLGFTLPSGLSWSNANEEACSSPGKQDMNSVGSVNLGLRKLSCFSRNFFSAMPRFYHKGEWL
jgi:hypothetical protein